MNIRDDRNNKISVVIAKDPNSYSSASLRAPKGFNVVEIMKKIKPGLLIKYGGHPEAAGFSCENDSCEAVRDEFERILEDYEPINADLDQYLPMIKELNPYNRRNIIYLEQYELNDSLFNDISSLEPFGQDFQMPKFVCDISNYNISFFGALQNHVRININNIQFIKFNISESDKTILSNNQSVFITFRTSKNVYNYIVSNQLVIDEFIEHG